MAANLLTEFDEVLHQIAVVIGGLVLHDGSHALRPMPVSRLRCGSSGMEPSSWRSYWVNTRFQNSRKRSQSQPGLQSGLPPTDLLAHVKVDLGARTAGAGGASGPEVVVLAQAGDVVLGNAQGAPHVMGLIVLGKDGKVQAVERQLELLGDELKGPGASLLLGDAAKREIAEHLEERQVTAVLADAVDVVGADALLQEIAPISFMVFLPW